ncbi:hypothetical protein ACPDHL_14695 [Myroides sp. C15-4]|uniref:hypothetical protein n=1 Tax=Myroides sp. C15-4 TaxID=3400532 RepID=UPI003D2F713B
MSDRKWRWGIGDGVLEMGYWRWEKGKGKRVKPKRRVGSSNTKTKKLFWRRESGDGKVEMGKWRWESGDGKWVDSSN